MYALMCMDARAERAARRTAASGLGALVDSKLFRALCEPARVDVLRQLTLLGRVDIGTLADRLPQDRSVISRHLGVLRDAGIVRREKRGRSVYFEIDGPAVVAQLQAALECFRALVPVCCPAPEVAAAAGSAQTARRRNVR